MSRTPSFLNAAFVTCAIAACAPTTQLTDAGGLVRFGKSDPTDGCVELGMVSGSGSGAAFTSSEDKMISAQNELRNHAAEEGANYVEMDAIGSDVHGMTITGRAFRCERLPSNLAPQAGGAGATPVPENDPEARLRKLKALFDKGLITQEDYDRRRGEILRSL